MAPGVVFSGGCWIEVVGFGFLALLHGGIVCAGGAFEVGWGGGGGGREAPCC